MAKLTNQEVQIRDPFIVTDMATRRYFLFGSTDKNIWGPGTGFDAYVGDDLQNWEGPYQVFRPDEDFFADKVRYRTDDNFTLAKLKC